MHTRVSYNDPTFTAIVYDDTGREHRFHYCNGEWFVEEHIYWNADFYRS